MFILPLPAVTSFFDELASFACASFVFASFGRAVVASALASVAGATGAFSSADATVV